MRDFLTGLQRSLFLTQGCSIHSVLELNEARLVRSADDFQTVEGHQGWWPPNDLNHQVGKCPLNKMCFSPPTWQISTHERRCCWLCIGMKIQSVLLGWEEGRKDNTISSTAPNQMRAEKVMRGKHMIASCQCNCNSKRKH